MSGGGQAHGICVDDSGNVYITGGTAFGSTFFECVTIKYNKLGDSIWTRVFQRPSRVTYGVDIKLDDSLNVYIACGGLIKYNNYGNLMWSIFDSSGIHKIILDSSGNIYTGGVFSKLTIAKYDRNGNRIWRNAYATGFAGNQYFGDFGMDKFGNLIIAGRSQVPATNYDFATIKYSNSGNQIWVRRYSGPSPTSNDGAQGVTTDLHGNIYVTGFSQDTLLSGDNSLTIKYDSSGNVVWINRISDPNIANIGYDIAVDSSQNVFIAGQLNGRTSTIKLGLNGNLIWYKVYQYGDLFGGNPPVIFLDSIYNVYVTATSLASGTSDYAAIKYDSSGDPEYEAIYPRPGTGFDYVHNMTVDKIGNIYLTGVFSSGSGYFGTVKFSPLIVNIPEINLHLLSYKIEQNYPNPFNPTTTIKYELPYDGSVSIKIYDITGRAVMTLVNENKTAGQYEVRFDGSNFASGIYYYRIESELHPGEEDDIDKINTS